MKKKQFDDQAAGQKIYLLDHSEKIFWSISETLPPPLPLEIKWRPPNLGRFRLDYTSIPVWKQSSVEWSEHRM